MVRRSIREQGYRGNFLYRTPLDNCDIALYTKTFKGIIDILDTEIRARGLGVMTSRLQRGGRRFESGRAHIAPWCSGQSCEALDLATQVRILAGLFFLEFFTSRFQVLSKKMLLIRYLKEGSLKHFDTYFIIYVYKCARSAFSS